MFNKPNTRIQNDTTIYNLLTPPHNTDVPHKIINKWRKKNIAIINY